MLLAVSALLLLALAIPLAFAGVEFVPGAAGAAPDWMLGLAALFDGGLDLSVTLYTVLLAAAVLAWAVFLPLAPRLGLTAVSALAAAGLAIFLLAPPLHSLDVFSYISYARLAVDHGLNPYEAPPAAIPLDEAASRVEDYRDAVSVYGPLFTLISLPLGALGVPFALWSLKLLAALSVAALAALVARLAAPRGVSPSFAVAFVALNPLVLVHVVGGAHNDGLMALLGMLAVAAVLAGRDALAGAGLLAAVAVKASALLYVPFAFVGSRRRSRLLAGGAGTLLLAAAVSLLAFGPSVVEAFGVLGGNQERISRWSVPATLARATGIDVEVLRVVLLAGFALAVLWMLAATAGVGGRPRMDWVRAAGWASALLLVASAYMVPWYLIWALPLVAISRDRALLLLAVALTVLQIPNGLPT